MMFGLKRLRAKLEHRMDDNYRTHRNDHFQLQSDIDALVFALKLKRHYKQAVVEYVPMEEKKNAN